MDSESATAAWMTPRRTGGGKYRLSNIILLAWIVEQPFC